MACLFAVSSIIYCLLFYCSYTSLADETDPSYWGVKDKSSTQLGKKVQALKQQALKLLSLRGINNFDETRIDSTDTKWDDIQMTDDLVSDVKASFDEEESVLRDRDRTDNENRATAPDFSMIPYAKWVSMPIKFSTSLIRSSALKEKVRNALRQIETSTGCITFKEVTTKPSTSFILYREVPSLGPGVCADSPLGRQPDVNIINVATTCQITGTLIHETMHSLGFAHTQQRPDVDQFLTINWRNINPQAASNFKPWRYALRNQGPFDYGSILMYPKGAFAINSGSDTMIPKQNPRANGRLMGQRDRLSQEDINILKKIYCGSGGGNEMLPTEEPSPSGGDCKDRLYTCKFWSGRGYCSSSSIFASLVQKNCAKTCHLC